MDAMFYLIGFLGAVFTLVMTIVMLLSFRKERRITTLSPFLSAALTFVMLPVFILFSGARLSGWVGLPALVLGLVVGLVRGSSTRLYYRDGQVMGKQSTWFLLGWGGSLVLAQLLNLLGSATLSSIGLAPVFLSTGTQVGINANLFLRRLRMRPPQPA